MAHGGGYNGDPNITQILEDAGQLELDRRQLGRGTVVVIAGALGLLKACGPAEQEQPVQAPIIVEGAVNFSPNFLLNVNGDPMLDPSLRDKGEFADQADTLQRAMAETAVDLMQEATPRWIQLRAGRTAEERAVDAIEVPTEMGVDNITQPAVALRLQRAGRLDIVCLYPMTADRRAELTTPARVYVQDGLDGAIFAISPTYTKVPNTDSFAITWKAQSEPKQNRDWPRPIPDVAKTPEEWAKMQAQINAGLKLMKY